MTKMATNCRFNDRGELYDPGKKGSAVDIILMGASTALVVSVPLGMHLFRTLS